MIPILFESTETAFTSNGIARLRDCLEATVVEERNGVYELDFQYPVDGANYDRIQVGRIVGVTHDETGDIQPFDVVGFSKPIDGVVTFHCVHISYRQSYITVSERSNTLPIVDTLSLAFDIIGDYDYGFITPRNPFTYWTDKPNTQYFCSALGHGSAPKTVRQVLGGIEGSILDTYGGEYEWDKWTVKLWASRGEYKDFSIRYGVNMLDYNEEYDSTGCYSSCIPYWTDGANTVTGNKQTNGGTTPAGRDQCIPLDVSDKFQNKPTKTQVSNKGAAVMNSKNPTIPSQNITVSFVRLQDMGEFADYQNLLQCKLCDSINVIFPDFNSSGTFKIVKTVWNVLTGKYEEMELGDLSVTLSEALGISNTPETVKPYVTYDNDGDVELAGNIYLSGHSGFVGAWNGDSISRQSNLSSGTTYQDMDVSLSLTTGIFIVIAKVQFGSNSTGRRAMRLTIDGTELSHTAVNNGAVSGAVSNVQTVGIIAVTSSSSTIKVQAFQNSGSSLACTTTYRWVRIK